MLYVAEQPEFPVGPLGVDEGLERTIQLLDGHLLLGLLVQGRTKSQTQRQGPSNTRRDGSGTQNQGLHMTTIGTEVDSLILCHLLTNRFVYKMSERLCKMEMLWYK